MVTSSMFHRTKLGQSSASQPETDKLWDGRLSSTAISGCRRVSQVEAAYEDGDDKHKKHKLRAWHRYRRLAKGVWSQLTWKRIPVYLLAIFVLYMILRHREATLDSKTGNPSGHRHRIEQRAALPKDLFSPSRLNHTVKNGLLQVNMQSDVHPIYQLIRDARIAWEEKGARQSKTLKEAVKEYRRRYGREPPQGFDKWWAYVRDNDVQLPDEYDQINHDIAPFFALSPKELQRRSAEVAERDGTYLIRIKHGSIRTRIQFARDNIPGSEERLTGQIDLLKPIARHLPDLSTAYWIHDGATAFISHSYREELLERVSEDEYIHPDDEVDVSSKGWDAACSYNAPLRRWTNGEDVQEETGTTFISDFKSYLDPCQHLTHTELHSYFAHRDPVVQALYPIFTLSKTALHSDILAVPTEQLVDDQLSVPWKEKSNSRLLWRGSNTGAYYNQDIDWSVGQRMRLVDMENQYEEGKDTVLPSRQMKKGENLDSASIKIGEKVLSSHYLDVAFTGEPIQCSEEDGTCGVFRKNYQWKDPMSHEEALQYKYVLDVDGNAWSARFQRLLMSGSLVFKSTVMPEWWTDRIQPWVHFIPVKLDYSDLFNSLSFFRGDMFDQGGQDALAQDIAETGQEWAQTYWRKEDMTAYLFRLYLEWGRLYSDNRRRMDFVYDESMEWDWQEA